jgi:hypothetical protein
MRERLYSKQARVSFKFSRLNQEKTPQIQPDSSVSNIRNFQIAVFVLYSTQTTQSITITVVDNAA